MLIISYFLRALCVTTNTNSHPKDAGAALAAAELDDVFMMQNCWVSLYYLMSVWTGTGPELNHSNAFLCLFQNKWTKLQVWKVPESSVHCPVSCVFGLHLLLREISHCLTANAPAYFARLPFGAGWVVCTGVSVLNSCLLHLETLLMSILGLNRSSCSHKIDSTSLNMLKGDIKRFIITALNVHTEELSANYTSRVRSLSIHFAQWPL